MAEAQRMSISVHTHRGCRFGIQTWPYPIDCRLQCWNASGQTTSRMGARHPSADRVPKAIHPHPTATYQFSSVQFSCSVMSDSVTP